MSTETITGAELSFEQLAEQVDQAVAAVNQLDDKGKQQALALKAAIEAFHKMGLTKIVQRLKADPRGKELLFDLVDEPSVYTLFAMHGLVRADLPMRVSRVLDSVRPYMQSHGGDVEFVRIEGTTAFVKLHGACNGCSMSAVTLREGVEEALFTHVPEIKAVEVVPNEPGPALITVDALLATLDADNGWRQGPPVEAVPTGRLYPLEIDDQSLLLINLNNQVAAYRNACAHQGLPLHNGLLDATTGVITCPWHGWCFDATSGECYTAPSAQLEPFPVQVRDGYIWVRPG